MKLVVPVRLYPDAAQAAALRDTLTLCNAAANLVSAQAFEVRVTGKRSLQRLVYGDLKEMGLSAQPAIHVARKVAGAYATLKASIRAGNLGEPGSKRRVKAGSKPIRFRPDAAQPFDDRCLSWQLDRRTVSIWTTAGRLSGIRFRCSPAQLARLRKPQRVTLHSWAFAQLGQFIAYKAAGAGVPLVYVDPAYTSQMCSSCGHVGRKNRPSQATFCCTSCGFAEHADVNAARNIAARGVADWAVSHAADDAA